MASYRNKPAVVEALQWTGENWNEIYETFELGNYVREVFHDPDAHSLLVMTLGGQMRCAAGDYLVQGTRGEFYPCKAEEFMDTYEAVDVLEAI